MADDGTAQRHDTDRADRHDEPHVWLSAGTLQVARRRELIEAIRRARAA
jgi:hypothetical protein